MKKVLAIILALVMVLSFAACGNSGKKEDESLSEVQKAIAAAEKMSEEDKHNNCFADELIVNGCFGNGR